MNTDWHTIVLTKLRYLVMRHYLSGTIGWKYEDENNRRDENNALLYLKQEGVIDVGEILQDEFYEDDNGVLVTRELHFGADDMTKANLGGYAYIEKFSRDAYERVCKEAGLNPNAETLRATLTLLDGVEPYITVGDTAYRFASLHSGKATDIINFAYQNIGQKIHRDKLKSEAGIITSNVNQAIKGTAFKNASSPLSKFTVSNSQAIQLFPFVDIDEATLDSIRQNSINTTA